WRWRNGEKSTGIKKQKMWSRCGKDLALATAFGGRCFCALLLIKVPNVRRLLVGINSMQNFFESLHFVIPAKIPIVPFTRNETLVLGFNFFACAEEIIINVHPVFSPCLSNFWNVVVTVSRVFVRVG
ncbi:MAG: hypothetical protein ACKO96_36415, partial [Flammeovirgaceae bacterium]